MIILRIFISTFHGNHFTLWRKERSYMLCPDNLLVYDIGNDVVIRSVFVSWWYKTHIYIFNTEDRTVFKWNFVKCSQNWDSPEVFWINVLPHFLTLRPYTFRTCSWLGFGLILQESDRLDFIHNSYQLLALDSANLSHLYLNPRPNFIESSPEHSHHQLIWQ